MGPNLTHNHQHSYEPETNNEESMLQRGREAYIQSLVSFCAHKISSSLLEEILASERNEGLE